MEKFVLNNAALKEAIKVLYFAVLSLYSKVIFCFYFIIPNMSSILKVETE